MTQQWPTRSATWRMTRGLAGNTQGQPTWEELEMIRGILSRLMGGGRSTGTTGRSVGGASTGGTRGSTGEIERGARTLFRGLSRRRRGL